MAPLSPVDTPLIPGESIGQLIAVTSSWIDLGSPDPLIADVSKQVLKLELDYAAFCGITYVLVPGPRVRGTNAYRGEIMQYARAILDALSTGPYMQIEIWMPMIHHPGSGLEQIGDLTAFVRPQFAADQDGEQQSTRLDLFGTWEAWDVIRTVCKYHPRLCVGKLVLQYHHKLDLCIPHSWSGMLQSIHDL